MSGKQNFIFFLGLTLIIVQYYLGGQLHAINSAIFSGPPAGGTYSGQQSVTSKAVNNAVSNSIPIPIPGLP